MKPSDRFSKPIKCGDGYVIDEQRGNAAIRSHILPTHAAALAYRAEQIRKHHTNLEGSEK